MPADPIRKFNGRMRKVLFPRKGGRKEKSEAEYKRARNLILATTERFDREGIVPALLAGSAGYRRRGKRLFAASTSLMRLRPTKSRISREGGRGRGCDIKGARAA